MDNVINAAGVYGEIEHLCRLIEQDDTDRYIIEKLELILRKKKFEENEKNKIVNLLLQYCGNSKKPRASNIFLNEAEILQKKTSLLSAPREIHVTVTLKCNLKCVMCCNGWGGTYEMDDKIYAYLKDNMKYLEKIVWKGGEVFLYKNFDKLMDLACKHNVHQVIITNGLLLNEERITLISKHNIELLISIDAVNKELYESIRTGADFDKLLSVLNVLKQARTENNKFDYSMATVLMSVNYHMIDEIVDFAYSYGFNLVHFFKCAPTSFNRELLLKDSHISIVSEKIKNKICEMNGKSRAFKIGTDISFKGNEEIDNVESGNTHNKTDEDISLENKEEMFCLVPWYTLMFHEETVSFGCQCKTITIGHYSSYHDIWNCKELVEYRGNIIEQEKEACRIFVGNNK